MQKVILMVPDSIRIGQQLFNFLEFLRIKKGYRPDVTIEAAEQKIVSRMADPFNISDDEWNKLYAEYLMTQV